MRIVAGHIVLDESPTSGASGGCVYNAAGEVVGLVTFGMQTFDMERVGGVTALYEEWWERLN
jgi:hypothetical protein